MAMVFTRPALSVVAGKEVNAMIKVLCAGFDALANLVLKEGAPFEYLVYPLGAAAWMSVAVMHVVSLNLCSFMGQWIPRFLVLWVFICF